jgi:3-oxoacyl-[acyl-carrier-protein] synthase II
VSGKAVITGIGLLSGLGRDESSHWRALATPGVEPNFDAERFAPYIVHPLGELDFSTQIQKKADLRQMETWQRIGVFAAGLALESAGIRGNLEYLDQTHLIVAAGSGERDIVTDMKVLKTPRSAGGETVPANGILMGNLRPTLFLAQLANLLAGNISIVHNVTGSSRTFMGEEMAGVAAVETAVRRIESGQGALFLVGGAFNAEREEVLLNFELGGMALKEAFAPVWERTGGKNSGLAPASAGAFLVIEEKSHAQKRGATPYATVRSVHSGRSDRKDGHALENASAQFAEIEGALSKGLLPILSGASGAAQATGEELSFLESLLKDGFEPAVRAYGSVLGHGVEAHFPLGVALAALSLKHGAFYPSFGGSGAERRFDGKPEQILVTSWGHWRGEAMALMETAEA